MLAAAGAGAYLAWLAWSKAKVATDAVGGVLDTASEAVKPMVQAVEKGWYMGGQVVQAAQDAGVQSWQLATPGMAIGQFIGGNIRKNPNIINPASDQNLIYQGVGAAGSYIAGDANWTVGGAIYDYFNPAYK